MPRKAKPKQEVAQAALFCESDFPEQPQLVELARRYEHNGKTATRDEERCAEMIEFLIVSGSARKTARKFHVGRNTLRGIVDVLERAGKLEPLKQRLLVKVGSLVEDTVDAIHEGVITGSFPETHLGLMGAQMMDKLLLLQGDPTVIVGVDRGPTAEQINGWLASVPMEASGPVELPEIWLNRGNPLLAGIPAGIPSGNGPGNAAGNGDPAPDLAVGDAGIGDRQDQVAVDGQSSGLAPDSAGKGGVGA